MAYYTTLDLINTVKNRMMLPDASSGSFSPAVILDLATEELQGPIASMIMAARENYYETYADQSVVGGQSVYAIPSRAIGGVISTAQYIANTSITPLNRMDPSEAYNTISGSPRGFYFQNNDVVLYPTPTQSVGTLRLRYYQRPSTLEQTINCANIQSFDAVAFTVTCAAVPSTWAAGTVVDFVPIAIPYTPYSLNTVVTGVTGNVVSFASLPARLVVGDWLALAEFTPIPEIVRELFSVLSQATVCKILEAAGDANALQFAQAKLQSYIQAASRLIQPRDVLTPKKVKSDWRSF